MADLDNGYIKLYRSLLDWEYFSEPNVLSVFLFCILKANHKDSVYKGEPVQRGELVTSTVKIAEATGLSRQQVRTALNKLIATNSITKWISPKNQVFIRVCEYEKFQSNHQINHRITTEQPPNNHPKNKKPKKPNNTLNDSIYNTAPARERPLAKTLKIYRAPKGDRGTGAMTN